MPKTPDNNTSPSVLITGASTGIGAAAVHVFAQAGYDVILTARRIDKLSVIAQRIQKLCPNQKIIPIECDVSSDDSVQRLFDRISQEFTALTVLVNNAGYGVYGAVEHVPVADFRRNLETNFLGVIRCVQGALPLLRKAAGSRPGPSIVMVSSIVGRRAMPKFAAYCATKFALEALSESLRVELRDERIAVSVINPGVTKTDFVDAANGERPDAFAPGKNAMSAETVARVILKAARRPVRNRYLTALGKLCILVQWISPRLLDAILLRTWRKG